MPPGVAHPGLVWDVSIGASTTVTQRVIANLFYRGLRFHRFPAIGDTLSTTTTVEALKQNASRPSGLAVLHIVTVDQEQRTVLDFWRCAMLPLRDPARGHGPRRRPRRDPGAARRPARRASTAGSSAGRRRPAGTVWERVGGNVVSSAVELCNLTLNIAAVHHDGSPRLVYGGHTIGIAAAHVSRALPGLATIVAWEHCDHLAPVHEGDTLHSDVTLEAVDGPLLTIHVRVRCDETDVLDWRLYGVHA